MRCSRVQREVCVDCSCRWVFKLTAVSKILDLPEGQEVAVIGTLYKEMKLKPSILDEYNKVPTITPVPVHSGYCWLKRRSHACRTMPCHAMP